MDQPDRSSWNMNGLIIEGISGTGKSTTLQTLLKSDTWTQKKYLSAIVLSEHHTQRVLEIKERIGALEVKDHVALLNRIVTLLEQFDAALTPMDWLKRRREGHKIPFLFERFHLSHVYHYADTRWEDVRDIDTRLAPLNAKICILTIDPDLIRQRILDVKKNRWNAYLKTIGETAPEIIQYFCHQQEKLLQLSTLTQLPCHIIDTSEKSVAQVVNEIFHFWGL